MRLVNFTLFNCLLDLSCCECGVISYILCVALLMDICVSCVLRVCELFDETIRNVFGCGCYFVAECYGSVYCVWRCFVG